MKQNLKKMLLALMVGIGMMGVVSAQAQTQEKVYVKVSDFYNLYISDEGVTGTVDQLCDAHVKTYDASYKYTGSWSWMGDRDIRCGVSTPTPSSTVGLQMRVHCLKGGSIDQELVGCYEERENCPDGTVKGEGNVCVVPCTGIGEDGTASPKGCVPLNAKECDEKYENGTAGFVSCDGEERKVCSFNDPFFTDPDAARFARECTYVHEFTHLSTRKKYDTYCMDKNKNPDDKGAQGASYPQLYLSEHEAYTASTTCLLEKQKDCGTNQTCLGQLGFAAAVHSDRADQMYRCGTIGGSDCK